MTRWDHLRDWLNRRLFVGGQRIAPRLPIPVVRGIAAALAGPAARLNWSHLRTYRTNLGVTLGREPTEAEIRAGIASWLRTYVELLALPGWPAGRAAAMVTAEASGEARLREAYAGPGVVVALPHLGNWDLAGAWAGTTGLPVTTVAENLGTKEFAAFTRLRSAFGLEVLAHDDPSALRKLAAALGRRRVICLLADRDLPGTGVPVSWAGRTVTMPAGPAMLARRTGATLIGAAGHYEGDGMRIEFSAPVAPRTGRDGLIAMTQDIADFFVAQVRAYPQDWHMMQPFFPEP